ncbi:TetR/AcrR family transcriptional regulator [Jidongwangia harbinensis]|uniref:TetR/AcrR family transcriptional regulator n=1 Tax=Jidongwangia harbinensis TaxID=2878561 RepID=UPI001CDA375A|nr:TetR/AcrR family transcriptional regulator [Jidongwangia harbinensis]MCA2215379.1 TetR/AcrR family transcriptional regulator [Jidongwangia harbinensis]
MDLSRLPPNLVVLYEPQRSPRRGPRPALTLDGVVAAAVEIADADGLGAVSMSRVAERLGFTTMSLYRYVKSKDELLLFMADAANGQPPPRPTPESWRTGLDGWARAVFGIYRRHPWLLRVPMSAPPAGPAQLRWMEAALANLAEVGLHEGQKLQIIQLLHGYARGEAQLSTDLSAVDAGDTSRAGYGEILRTVTSPETHPALHRLAASGLLDESTAYDDEADFGFGLHTILDGVERLIAGHVPARPA